MEEAKKHGGVWEMLSQAVLPFSLALVLWTRLPFQAFAEGPALSCGPSSRKARPALCWYGPRPKEGGAHRSSPIGPARGGAKHVAQV